MNKLVIYAILVLIVLVLVFLILTMNTGEAPECVSPTDCEGLPHDECEGEWRCANGRCVWDCAIAPTGECSSDSDCMTAGCSGELCVPKGMTTPLTSCEWKEEYGCLELNNCKCISGKCKWEDTEDYLSCLEDMKQGPPLIPV